MPPKTSSRADPGRQSAQRPSDGRVLPVMLSNCDDDLLRRLCFVTKTRKEQQKVHLCRG